MEKITLLLVDDHRLVRETWGVMLNGIDGFQVVGSVSGNEDVAMMVLQLRPDIILMDIAMKPVDGFELTKQICGLPDSPKIIGVSMYTVPAYAKRMLMNGAKGYLTKSSTKEELTEAILKVHAGKQYICEEIRNMISFRHLVSAERKDILTERELAIIALIRQGLSSKEIGPILDVQARTVEVHRYNILKKLKLANTAALVNYANQHGLQ